MRVLMQNRLDAATREGGDSVQMYQTRRHLQAIGVQVDVSLEIAPDLSSYDVVHLYNINRVHETLLQARHARALGKPYVVSTIFHDLREFDGDGRFGIDRMLHRLFDPDRLEILRAIGRASSDLKQLKAAATLAGVGFRAAQREVVMNAGALLPNSVLESKAIESRLGLDAIDAHPVVNGVDPDISADESVVNDLPPHLRAPGSFILCVGRIEPVKNQLQLVEAVAHLGLPLVLVGDIGRRHRHYGGRVLAELTKIGGLYLGKLDYRKVLQLYRLARCHVLPSWFETTGLVSLEALAQGCPIVTTDRGFTSEYFTGLAAFCDPTSSASIREAILAALDETPESCRAKQAEVLSRYTWATAAKQTKEAYAAVLESHRGRNR